MEDSWILKLLWDRAEAGLTALAERFGPRLQRTARQLLADPRDVEECVSDTYLAVWNVIPPRRPEPLAGFVYQTGRNQALKRLRHNRAQKRNAGYETSLEELAGSIPGPCLEETFDARELGRSIDRYLSTLSRENRVLFLRRYWFGDATAELAREFGLRENTVSVRLSRIRSGLREYLIQEGYDHA